MDTCTGSQRWEVDLQECGLQADLHTATSAASACAHGEQWQLGLLLAETCSRRHRPDAQLYSTMLFTCEKGFQWELAVQLLSKMVDVGIRLDPILSSIAIRACATRRSWDLALWVLNELCGRDGDPGPKAYLAAVDALEAGNGPPASPELFEELCRKAASRMLRCKACLLSPGQKGLMGLFERGLLLQNMPWPAGDFSDSEREAKRQRARTCDVPATFLCISAKIADANGFATLTEDSVSTGRNGPLAAGAEIQASVATDPGPKRDQNHTKLQGQADDAATMNRSSSGLPAVQEAPSESGSQRLPVIPRQRTKGRLPTVDKKLPQTSQTSSSPSKGSRQSSARGQDNDDLNLKGFSLIKYIQAFASQNRKKAWIDTEFLNSVLQSFNKRYLNEREDFFGYTSLALACSVGHAGLVKLLLEAQADSKIKCNLGNTPLHLAARAGHVAAVQVLVQHKVALDSKNAEGWTPLMWAAMSGRADVVAALLAAHAEAKAKDVHGMTALMWATRHGHVDVMRSLLGDGPDLSITDFDGHSVMYHARQHKAARKMLERFEDLNRRLLRSAQSGDIREASRALEAGAFVDTLDADGASPLLHAASQKNMSMVRLLTRHGADPSLEASRASSPWLRNAEYQTSIQEVLRDAVKANRLLLSAAKEGWWKGVFQAIEHGAWLEIPDEAQKTPLGWAASHGSVQAVRHLIQARASLNAREQCGWTPIHWAVHRNWAEVASVLHHHNADVHAKAFSGDTVVHLAAKSNHCFSLVLLSCASANLNVKGFNGLTPIQATAMSGKIAATQWLLKLRADAEVRAEGGRSIIALAALHGQHALLDAILDKTSGQGSPVTATRRDSGKATKKKHKEGKELKEAKEAKEVKEVKEVKDFEPLEKVVEVAEEADDDRGRSATKPKKGESRKEHSPSHKDVEKDPGKKEASERKPSPNRKDQRKDQKESKESKEPKESKPLDSKESKEGPKEGPDAKEMKTLQLDVPKGSKGKIQEGGKSHLETPDPADSAAAMSQQSWRSRKTDATEEEEGEGSEIDAKKAARKFKKQPDMALYEQAEAFNKTLPAKVDVSASQALAEVDDDGRTPLGLAVQAGHLRVTSLLLERKASLDVADTAGNTILMLAARGSSRSTLMIVELLLAARADVQAQNEDKCTAADVAKASKVRELLKSQLERLQVGKKLGQSRSLPSLKAPVREKENGDAEEPSEQLPQGSTRGGRVRLEHLPANVPPDILEDAILTLVSLRRAPQPRAIEVAVHPITQRTLGHAYVDYDDEGMAIQLADAKCDAKKDPFRGTVQLLKEEVFRPLRRVSQGSI
ncbi:ANK1 [Symbiodinium natans]|uniref:ANK1 protein n=1 Tax=Symbiodinium natans TaxID=878477 RepID=A0A812UWQ5_9DINO|nr:ANK1 [Symbiodinium natans]